MNAILVLAGQEIRAGLRNRWVATAILLLAGLALCLAVLGSAPVGTIKASGLSIAAASLSSLSVYLLPLIALLLAYDSVVGETDQGTMALLLTYPVRRWQVLVGKWLGHAAILAVAIVLGFGGAALLIAALDGGDAAGWRAFALLLGSSILLGLVFLGLGTLISVSVRERAAAASLAVLLWLFLVVLYDLALLGLLVLDTDHLIGQSLFATLMLASPTDAYRIVNLTGSEGVRQVAGMAGLASDIGPAVPLLSLLAWLALPLSLAVRLFVRKEL